MIKVGRIHAHPPKRAKTRRWWRYLDLLLIVLLFSFLLVWLQGPASARLFFSTIASMAQPTSLTQSYTGLNTIAIPLQKLALQAQPTSVDCGNIDLPQGDLQTCLEGQNSPDTYTQNPAPKIQNPLAKGSSLFFYTPPNITIDDPNIRTLWGFVLGIVDAFLSVLLVLNGVRVILTGSVFRYSRVIEELPGILLALIVAHISLTFITMTIGLNNNMVNYIYTFAEENPNIQRSASGIGDGDKDDIVLRVFFPTLKQSDQQTYKSMDFTKPAETARQYPGPGKVEPDGKGTTSDDIEQFNEDMLCSVKSVNFDTMSRKKLFGDGKKIEDTPVYVNIKGRSVNIIQYADANKDDPVIQHPNAEEIRDMESMPQQMKSDLEIISQNPVKWYQDYIALSKRLAGYEDKFLIRAGGSATSYFAKVYSELNIAAIQLFDGAMGAEDTPKPNHFEVVGDAVIYSCENDATGSTFQLVPNDINFTDLFQNLSEMGNALKVTIKLLALMLLGQMIIRLFFINLYIITAPFGIACWALPGKSGQPVARMWLQGFLSTVLVQFLMVLAAIITQVLLGNVLAFVAGDPNHVIGNLKHKTLADLMHIACLWFVIRIPSLIGGASMNTMIQAGQMVSQAVNTTIAMQITQFQMTMQVAIDAAAVAGTVIAVAR